jgi:hypothetical protein
MFLTPLQYYLGIDIGTKAFMYVVKKIAEVRYPGPKQEMKEFIEEAVGMKGLWWLKPTPLQLIPYCKHLWELDKEIRKHEYDI